MKIIDRHYEMLTLAIARHLIRKPYLPVKYATRHFPRADKVKDLDKRFRWDLFYNSTTTVFRFDLYEYLDDSHIDTALRRIVKPLKRNH